MYTNIYFVKRFLPLSQELIALELNFPNICELRVKNKVLENQKDDGSGKFAINMG